MQLENADVRKSRPETKLAGSGVPASWFSDTARRFPRDRWANGLPDPIDGLMSLPDLLSERPHEDDPVDQRRSSFAATTERLAPLLNALDQTVGEARRVGHNRRQVRAPTPEAR
jgi:hypothetical protein